MAKNLPLTQMVAASGCAAKLGPGVLTQILKDLPNVTNRNLLVGFDTSDDACVYKITEEIAAIHTVDFFTPMVDDPYQFGQIAAANALSDVYAMGGKPAVAMNLLCVPNCLPKETIRLILKGGHDKAVEAGCTIAGWHTIQDSEPKYGLSVTGYVHPDKILKNVGARPGDLLVLTKPIGTGVLTTAVKADMIEPGDYQAMIHSMTTLNACAAEIIIKYPEIHACTDVTGFGLLGHSYEMASGSNVTLKLSSRKIPLLHGARELATMGLIPAGTYRNMDHVKPHLEILPSAEECLVDLISDPQTSGGLLVALPAQDAGLLLEELSALSLPSAVIGEVLEKQDKALIIE